MIKMHETTLIIFLSLSSLYLYYFNYIINKSSILIKLTFITTKMSNRFRQLL